MREAAPAAGIPVLDDFNDLSSPEGAAYVPVNVDGFARWNTAFAYLDAARARENLTVIGDALVDRVLLDGQSACGAVVFVEGHPVELGANLVIVSAGAFGSPGILMRSGIGPGDQLAELGIAVALGLPGVGANLQDHCGINIVFRAGPELERELSRQEASGRMVGSGTIVRAASRQCAKGTWDLHLVSWAARDTQGITGGEWRVQLSPYVMKPISTGAVRLRSPDPREPLYIDLGFLSDPNATDLAVVVDGAELVRRFAATETLGRLLAAEALPGPEQATRDQLASYVRDNVRGYFHGACTCRIGAEGDPRGGRGHGRRRARDRGALGLRRFDRPHDPEGEHQPDNYRGRGADRGAVGAIAPAVRDRSRGQADGDGAARAGYSLGLPAALC